MFRVMCGKGSPMAVLWRIGVILKKQEVDVFIYRREEPRLQPVVPLLAPVLEKGAGQEIFPLLLISLLRDAPHYPGVAKTGLGMTSGLNSPLSFTDFILIWGWLETCTSSYQKTPSAPGHFMDHFVTIQNHEQKCWALFWYPQMSAIHRGCVRGLWYGQNGFGRQQKAVGMLEGVTMKLQAELEGNKQTN